MLIRRKILKTLTWSIIVLFSLFLQGCMVAAIGAGIGAVKYANSKERSAEIKCKETYNNYLMTMQKINLERVKSHLKQENIISMEEYCKV